MVLQEGLDVRKFVLMSIVMVVLFLLDERVELYLSVYFHSSAPWVGVPIATAENRVSYYVENTQLELKEGTVGTMTLPRTSKQDG